MRESGSKLELKGFASYHGRGWKNRKPNAREDIRNGVLWSDNSVEAEWMPLKRTLLFIPDSQTVSTITPNEALHLRRIDFRKLHDQLTVYANKLNNIGIEVQLLDVTSSEWPEGHELNLMFMRDSFSMTPYGCLISKMASSRRAIEPAIVSQKIAELKIPIVFSPTASGASFEGADLLWIDSKTALLGVGERTNAVGAKQLETFLQSMDVDLATLFVPKDIQHLLGVVQLLDANTAAVRVDKVSKQAILLLMKAGIDILPLHESEEIIHNQAMNFLVVGPRMIIMVAGNPETSKILSEGGITIVDEADVSELVSAGGGLACATGPIKRSE